MFHHKPSKSSQHLVRKQNVTTICSSHEFESLSYLTQRLACVDVRVPVQMRATFQKKVNFAGDSFDSKNEAEIGLAERTKKKEPVSCLFAKKEKEKFGSDVTKADRIFDLLLQER